jgi:hypothetical protein
MLSIQKQSKMKAVRFAAIIPLLALLMMAFSFTERSEQGRQTDGSEQKLILAAINKLKRIYHSTLKGKTSAVFIWILDMFISESNPKKLLRKIK